MLWGKHYFNQSYPPIMLNITTMRFAAHSHLLGGTLFRVKQFSSVLYSGVEPFPYESLYSSIMDASV